jgi:hypothetical protein
MTMHEIYKVSVVRYYRDPAQALCCSNIK